MKYGLLFSGQGSQYMGMGRDFYEAFPSSHELFKRASDTLGYDLRELIDREETKLNDTLYTQPAILVTSLMIYRALQESFEFEIEAMSGFSLGEYSALGASGIFSEEEIITLIKARARLMEEASAKTKGKMAAVIGMDQGELEKACDEVSDETGFVKIANYNCPGQLVVSGTIDKVDALAEAVKDKARRFLPVKVSGAFHTELMASAGVGLSELIKTMDPKAPNCEIYMNVTAKPLVFNELEDLMVKQVQSPVLFEQTLRNMMEKVDAFIEIGPGKVLSGFVRKIDRNFPVYSVEKVEDLKQFESGE